MKKKKRSQLTIGIIGAGSFGGALAQLVSPNVAQVQLFFSTQAAADAFNQTHVLKKAYPQDVFFLDHVHGVAAVQDFFVAPFDLIIWALPSAVSRKMAQHFAPYFKGSECVLHTTKGLEQGTFQTVSQILRQECHVERVGFLGGPHLAKELVEKKPTVGMVASFFSDLIGIAKVVLTQPYFEVYPSQDLLGSEWASVYKNILAIGIAALEGAGLGKNAQAVFLTAGLMELQALMISVGGDAATGFGLAGLGDALATCGSHQSRNYRFGFLLGIQKTAQQALAEMHQTVEGMHSTAIVLAYAQQKKLHLPIVKAIFGLIEGNKEVRHLLKAAQDWFL